MFNVHPEVYVQLVNMELCQLYHESFALECHSQQISFPHVNILVSVSFYSIKQCEKMRGKIPIRLVYSTIKSVHTKQWLH